MLMNLLPKPHEIREQSIMFNESMKGFGFKTEVLIPKNIDLPDIGYQQNVGYDDADKFIAYISLDPHPKPKLLQSLGWDIEDEESKPILCYVSRYLQRDDSPRNVNTEATEILPTKYTRLTLDYDYEDKGKEFIVTRVSSNSFNPVYYIMMIVPYRPRVPNNPDPLQDNNTEMLNMQEVDSSFKFLGKTREKQVDIKY